MRIIRDGALRGVVVAACIRPSGLVALLFFAAASVKSVQDNNTGQ